MVGSTATQVQYRPKWSLHKAFYSGGLVTTLDVHDTRSGVDPIYDIVSQILVHFWTILQSHYLEIMNLPNINFQMRAVSFRDWVHLRHFLQIGFLLFQQKRHEDWDRGWGAQIGRESFTQVGLRKGSLNLVKFWVVVSNIFYVHPYLGKIPILTNIFQRGWNHQLETYYSMEL